MAARQTRRGPALLCYDGSDQARAAIKQAGALSASSEAAVVTVWESVGSLLLRHPAPGLTEFGRDVRRVSEAVIEALDTDSAAAAEETATEGVEIAGSAGFDARAQPRRAIGAAGERSEVTVWRELLAAADEEDASFIVLGSRGQSGIRSTLLGSVSYGLLHNSRRPLLIVPPGPPGE